MRIVEGFCLREVLGEKIVVPTGAAAAKLSGIAVLNETGEFLFQLLQTEQTEETLLAAMRHGCWDIMWTAPTKIR